MNDLFKKLKKVAEKAKIISRPDVNKLKEKWRVKEEQAKNSKTR